MAKTLPPGFVTKPQGAPEGFVIEPQAQNAQQQQPERTIGEMALGALETGASIASGVVAEPAAGIAGLLSLPFTGVEGAVENIEAVRQALTFQPRTEAGQSQQQAVGELVAPVAEVVGKVESGLGSAVLDATGSPELATVAHTLPTAFLELIGVKGLKGARLSGEKLSPNVATAIQQSAPKIEDIKRAKTEAYKKLDESGVKVRPSVYQRFATNLKKKLAKEGIDRDLHPKSTAALNRILDDIGQAKSLSELDTIRKIARSAAQSIDRPDARLGTIIVDELDRGIDQLSTQIGGQFKEARGLAQRAFKSETITDMIENASHTASGMENGLRIEARKLLKNKKKLKGFTKDEIDALKQIEQGTTAANLAKFLGKFGLTEGQATSMLGFSVGAGGGGAIGSLFGPSGTVAGAITVPVIGQFAKSTAQRLTLNNTKFADDLARSGKNAKAVVRSYLKHTPIKNRSVSDLTDLLLDVNLDPATISALPTSATGPNKIVSDAKHYASELRRRARQAASVAAITQPIQAQEQ